MQMHFWIKPEMFNNENSICYFDYDLHKDFMYTSDSFKTQWFYWWFEQL